MRKINLIIIILLSFLSIHAQNDIDIQQNRIDLLDQVEDQKSAACNFNYLYFEQIDMLQELLAHHELDKNFRDEISLKLLADLSRIDHTFLQNQRKGPGHYMYLEEFLKKKIEGKANLFLEANPTKAYDLISLICQSEEIENFLIKESKNNPEILMQNADKFRTCDCASEYLHIAAQNDPIAAKLYFDELHPLFQQMKSSKKPLDQLILTIAKESTNPSISLSLLDDIYHKRLSIQEADALSEGKNDSLMKRLFALVLKEPVLAKNSIDKLLTDICTKKIRVINAAYESHDSPQRFKSLQEYHAIELYHIIVYSQEEIFTSSFNGIYKMLLEKAVEEKLGMYQLLEAVNFNQFRTFIKMCSSYGKLEDFLSKMQNEEKAELIARFVQLNEESDLLKESVCIADAMGSVKDIETIKSFESNLLENYRLCITPELQLSYTLLIKLFANTSIDERATFNEISDRIDMPSLIQVGNASLYGADGIHTQLHLFYNDEDGKVSYATFMKMWDKQLWRISDHEAFVVIKNLKNNAVQILANKPSHAENGVYLIHDYLAEEDAEIEVLVHRGHSFYVVNSLYNLTSDVNIVMLGSCGGYNQVLDVLNKAPNAHIISTKQIGSHTVNNPMLYQLANMVNTGEEIYWDKFWKKLSDKLAGNSFAMQRFSEYIAPHQNLGAAFIQAYRQHLND